MKSEQLNNKLSLFLGVLTVTFFLIVTAVIFQMLDTQRSLREATYDQGGIASIQIRLHYELLMVELSRLEMGAAGGSVQEAATQYDILYERLQAHPGRPPYDQFLDAEILALISRLFGALKKEVDAVDRAVEGDIAALNGMRERLKPLRRGIERVSSRSTQLASDFRSANRAKLIRIADWLAVLILGLVVSGSAFVVIIWRQLKSASRRNSSTGRLRQASKPLSPSSKLSTAVLLKAMSLL